jgi:alpha-galactosidase
VAWVAGHQEDQTMQIAVFVAYVAAALGAGQGANVDPLPFHSWAATPPMGWNSWDCFATTVTEAQTKAHADYMAEHLKSHGWQYIVVDIQWYEPNANSYDYRRNAQLVMDEWGRLLPAVNRFPSTAGGAGFRPLADYVHAKGLKFGIHLMRGIPRQAVNQNLAVKGTGLHAQDVANKASTCPWNPDMYGVDMSKPGSQDYYNSVFELIASWGVDYVKVDDISRPYHEHEKEIEAVRKAIDHAGRPIVLSLSPGETALDAADHVARHANLWRISDDFWDSWPALYEQFARLKNWNPHRGPGYWPDADMLPFGVLDLGRRKTRFTPDEQVTVMTLWSIARSPLMHGGDMTKMDDFTLGLLTNDEVLAVNQHSANNRPLFERDKLIAWTADVPGSKDKVLALFNAQDPGDGFDPAKALFTSEIVRGGSQGQAAEVTANIEGAKRLFLQVTTAGDGFDNDHADWIEPRLIGPKGEMRVTDLKWVKASAGWGETQVNKSVSGQDLQRDGQPVAYGIGTHAQSLIEYELPAGYTTFKATGIVDRGGRGRGSVQFIVTSDKAIVPVAQTAKVTAPLADLGIAGPANVRNLWTHKDLGVSQGEFTADLPFHGAGLYRLSPGQ